MQLAEPLLSRRLKNKPEKFLIFSQKNDFLYFRKIELLYFGKWNF